MLRLAMLCTAALALSACNRNDAADEPANQANVANLAAEAPANGDVATLGEGWSSKITDAAGKDVGLLSYLNGDPKGVPLTIRVHDLPPGDHGMHLHAVGKCEGPKFESAGAHWNPAGRQHGHDNPQGPHAGDIGNLPVDANGNGRAEYLLANGSGDHPQGLSLVIHADRDDDKTDPSGNSGERIACAVLLPAPN
jgi:Cu-Zn family superoxide dismutase